MKRNEREYEFDPRNPKSYEFMFEPDEEPDAYTQAVIEGCARTVESAPYFWSNPSQASAESLARFIAQKIRSHGPMWVNVARTQSGIELAATQARLDVAEAEINRLNLLLAQNRSTIVPATSGNWPPTVRLKEDVLTEELFEPPKISADLYHELMRLHERVGGSIFREAAELIKSQAKEIFRQRSRGSGLPDDD